jgi:uncharacterized protein YndB with AHSA1/START domain
MTNDVGADREAVRQAPETTEADPSRDEAGETRSAAGEVHVAAAPERVWQALTDAHELERWFPLHARVEPGEGGSLWMSWGEEFSEAMPIEAWDPPRHLRTRWPWGNQAVVTDYWLEAEGRGTRVRVVTSGFSLDATWDDWVEGTTRGWAYELRALKHYLERKEGQDRRALFLRRRVRLPREEVWARLIGDGGLAPPWTRGERIDHVPPVQTATLLADPPGAMTRASVEPVQHGAGSGKGGGPEYDATLWISLWGDAGRGLESIDREWTALLERVFPEGTTLRESR